MGATNHYNFNQITLPNNQTTGLLENAPMKANVNLISTSWNVQALGQTYCKLGFIFSPAVTEDLEIHIVGATENNSFVKEVISVPSGEDLAYSTGYYRSLSSLYSTVDLPDVSLTTIDSYALLINDGAVTSHFVTVVGNDTSEINWTLSAALFQFKQKDNADLLYAQYYPIDAAYTNQTDSMTAIKQIDLPVGRFKLSLKPADMDLPSTNSLIWQAGFRSYQ